MIVKQYEYYHTDADSITSNLKVTKSLDKGKYISNNVSIKELQDGLELTVPYNEVRINATPGVVMEINGEKVLIGEAGVYNILYRENVELISIKVSEETNFNSIDHIVITLMSDSTTNSSTSTTKDSSSSSTKVDKEEPTYNHDRIRKEK